MKNFYLFLFLFFIYFFGFSQDTIRLKHINYISVYSTNKKYPIFVEWWLTKKMVDCKKPLKRKDNFSPDPLLLLETNIGDNYVNSGLDRGHMMPAADNLCQTQLVQDECFYFSNISPQYHSLNAGDWKKLEIWTRYMVTKHDSIHIWSGNLGEEKKIGMVSVPKFCWKVIYIKKTNEWFYYIFKNVDEKQTGFELKKVDKQTIESKTGLKFQI